jgi:hypothetical protein
MMRTLDRYVGALMIFTFGFAILSICGIWLKRGNFAWTVQDHSQLVSAAQTPKGFFGYIIPSLVLGVLLVAFSIYVTLRVSRARSEEVSTRWFAHSDSRDRLVLARPNHHASRPVFQSMRPNPYEGCQEVSLSE